MTRIKICGISHTSHALAAVNAGANYIGMVFAASPRRVDPHHALEIADAVHNFNSEAAVVGVFVNETPAKINHTAELCQLDYVQLSGDESWETVRQINFPVIKAIHVPVNASASDIAKDIETGFKLMSGKELLILLDTQSDKLYGGTGQTFNWMLLQSVPSHLHIIVAGGLNPENVGRLIEEGRPWGVDVSSGVETGGHKDTDKIQAFIKAVRKLNNRQG